MRILIRILLLVSSLSLFSPLANATTCGQYPVCMANGVVISNAYGKLTATQDMYFDMFGTYANGTIIFDVHDQTQYQQRYTFNAQSFGNGSFDVRFLGPKASLIVSQATSPSLWSSGSWGAGPEVLYNSLTSTSVLLVSFQALPLPPFTGPPSSKFTIPLGTFPLWLIPLFLVWTVIISVLTVSLIKRRRQRKKNGPLKNGRVVG